MKSLVLTLLLMTAFWLTAFTQQNPTARPLKNHYRQVSIGKAADKQLPLSSDDTRSPGVYHYRQSGWGSTGLEGHHDRAEAFHLIQ